MSPYADPQNKIEQMKRWRKEKIGQGYGKWLYQRRKLKYDDAANFRTALEGIVELGIRTGLDQALARNEMLVMAQEALRTSAEAEAALGEFQPEEGEEDANLRPNAV